MTQAGHDQAIKEVKQAPTGDSGPAAVHAELHHVNRKDQLSDARKQHRPQETSPHVKALPRIDVGDAASSGDAASNKGPADKATHLPNHKAETPHPVKADEDVVNSKTITKLKGAADQPVRNLVPADEDVSQHPFSKPHSTSDKTTPAPEKQNAKSVPRDEDVQDSSTITKVKAYLKSLGL